jgi:hypothetical protein
MKREAGRQEDREEVRREGGRGQGERARGRKMKKTNWERDERKEEGRERGGKSLTTQNSRENILRPPGVQQLDETFSRLIVDYCKCPTEDLCEVLHLRDE